MKRSHIHRLGSYHPFIAVFLSLLFIQPVLSIADSIPTPDDFFGHRIGADRKLAHWDDMVKYVYTVAELSPRVNAREVGKATLGHPLLLVEISDEETIADLETYKALQRRLYFQDHRPGRNPNAVHTPAQKKELFEKGKVVVLVTCSIHATEVGAAQMSMELIHWLATGQDMRVKRILDNVIFLLVPSLNPDGQAMVVDWYNAHVGTDHEGVSMPWLYHPYVGHDNNRDMYMYSQQETRLIGQVLYKDWFPSIWLDEHQMGSSGARMFVMPATDPININVHPLIYRLNGIFGQAQGAALEAAGKIGIVYDQSYTNFWEGAMAWTGWWHNQVGMLTELASVRTATPIEQQFAKPGTPPSDDRESYREARRRMMEEPEAPLPPPRDVQPRTNYPRPWLGGRWTLRDIVEYDLIATQALLETAADMRHQLIRQFYEINHSTIASFSKGQEQGTDPNRRQGYGKLPPGISPRRSETGKVIPGFDGAGGTPYAVIVPVDQHDPPTVAKMLQTLELGGVVIEQATSPFEAGGISYPKGTYVIRLAQVFGRYAKDMLEPQIYPDVRLAPSLPPRPPYDVTAWSLGMQMGVKTIFIDSPFETTLERVKGVPLPSGKIIGSGNTYIIDASYNDGFRAVNRLWGQKASIRRAQSAFQTSSSGKEHRFPAGTWIMQGVGKPLMESTASELGLTVYSVARLPNVQSINVRKPRIGVYQPWSSNMDEGWTRWLLEHFEFDYTTLHPQDLRAAGAASSKSLGQEKSFEIPDDIRSQWPPHVADRAPKTVSQTPLTERFDVLLFTHQEADDIVTGSNYPVIPPVYRGGIGEKGLVALQEFVNSGGTIVALGDATELFIEKFSIPVRNVVAGLEASEFLIPGSIVNIQTDPSHPIAWGMPAKTHGFFTRNPVFGLIGSFQNQSVSVPARYPNAGIRASGWVRGEKHITGQAAAIQVIIPSSGKKSSRIILLGLRPQHRVQTHANFKLLFNSLYAIQ